MIPNNHNQISSTSFGFGNYRVTITGNHAEIDSDNGDVSRISFYEMQCIKNQAFGSSAVAIEIFPKNKELIDGAETRHLWAMDDISVIPNLSTGHLVNKEYISRR